MKQFISEQKDNDIRKLIAECQRRDDTKHTMRQKDEDVRQLISECQRKDEMIMSLVSSLKDQMTVLGLAAKSKLEYDEGSLEPERVAQWSFRLVILLSIGQK